jgi:alanyl-tRNA synthetase
MVRGDGLKQRRMGAQCPDGIPYNPSPDRSPSRMSTSHTSDDIRRLFIEFFQNRPSPRDGHAFIPSSPVVPHEDPTLLFTNAGMNQFKPIFLGQVDPASPMGQLRRAANSQKCIRAGGKHNDLEDVGKDTYHHTFFEMLGNWSFGDYFKAEAIAWAWEFLTRACGIPADRLYATYFGGSGGVPRHSVPSDERESNLGTELGTASRATPLEPDLEARELWRRFLPESRILPGNMKDNFWEMGDTGPCGPCSEIHYDRIGGRDAAHLVNAGDPDVIEIWNLVFIQFNREGPELLKPLPARHVDTGMGFERLVSILQHKRSNYDTDVFESYFRAIQQVTGAPPYRGRLGPADEGNIDTAYRVIADHIRTLTFAITDGAVPSNEGRGYVLRRILRRAVRYGRQMLGARTGFFSQLVPVVVEKMGHAFPELARDPDRIINILREEEESFGRTLDRGLELFEEAVGRAISAALRSESGKNWMYAGSIKRRAQLMQDPAFEERWRRHFFVPGTDEQVNLESLTASVASRYAKGPFTISGDDAFKLYDTYGFPPDLTMLMAEERGLRVDTAEYERQMEEARQRSRGGAARTDGARELALDADALEKLRHMWAAPTDDSYKFESRDIIATVKAIYNGDNFDQAVRADMGKADRMGMVGVVLDKTNFYAEMGGQVADTGRLFITREARSSPTDVGDGGQFKVEQVRAFGGFVLHIGRVVRGEIRVGDSVQCSLDQARRAPIAANHTATHLLNLALRSVLGEHVEQKGSLVAPDRLRFDLTNPGPVSAEQLARVEEQVRTEIQASLPVHASVVPLAQARRINGVRAVFGEAYPDPVRVVSIGRPVAELLEDPENPGWRQYSIEFCGGTHLSTTGQAQEFAIISEEAVAKGIRRVAALTGVPARAAIEAAEILEARLRQAALLDDATLPGELQEIARQLDELTMPVSRKHQLRAQIATLQERLKAAQKQHAAARRQQAAALARDIAQGAGDSSIIVSQIELASDRAALEQAIKTIRDLAPAAAVMLLSPDPHEGKVNVMAAVPEPLTKRGLRAGDWVREVTAILGGKGGGRPDAAQGAGPELSKLDEALDTASRFADARLA